LCGRLRLKHFQDVAEMSYKTKTGEEVTDETDEFLFRLSLVVIICVDIYDKTKFIRLDGDLLSGSCVCLILVLTQLCGWL